MIVVESRFRVANGMEQEVRSAFLARPRLVDRVIGFLGMEVFQVQDDATVFHLITRWTDRPSYETWHRSEAHHDSHAFIPRGLKLEASYTRLTVLDRIDPANELPSLTNVFGDASSALAAWVTDAATTCVAMLDRDGCQIWPNAALAERLGTTKESMEVAGILANEDAAELAARIARLRADNDRGTDDRFLVNFVSASQSPFTLACRIDAQPDYVFMFAEEPDAGEGQLLEQLMHSNNQLAVLAREREQQRALVAEAHVELSRAHAELAAALEELDKSHWHIRRIQEVLPICMECGDVKSDQPDWQPAREFLASHSMRPFLSHGYCPPCGERLLAALSAEDTDVR